MASVKARVERLESRLLGVQRQVTEIWLVPRAGSEAKERERVLLWQL